MKGVYINDRFINYDDIVNEKIWVEDVFVVQALRIIKGWLIGQKSFKFSTSGSTGKPRVIEIRRKQIEESVQLTARALKLAMGETSLICLDLNFIAGFMMLIRSLIVGMKMHIVKPSSNPFTHFSYPERIDFAAMVPLQLVTILNNTSYRVLIDRIKKIIVGGAPVDQRLRERLQNINPQVYATYGMTETVSHIALQKLNGSDQTDYFTAFPDVEIGQDFRDCLTIKSVLTNHQKLITNDLVDLRGTDQFKWLGRFDRVINSGGIKIYMDKLEDAIGQILNHSGINNRFVVEGVTDHRFGEKVVLIIEGDLERSKDQLMYQLRKGLLSYEVPKDIVMMKKLKETETQKIDRIYLKNILNANER